MAEVLMVTWDGGGNLTPALSVAAELRQRGHVVRFLGHGQQRAQRVLQNSESWKTLEPWLDTCNTRMAFSVARGLVFGSMLTDA